MFPNIAVTLGQLSPMLKNDTQTANAAENSEAIAVRFAYESPFRQHIEQILTDKNNPQRHNPWHNDQAMLYFSLNYGLCPVLQIA